MRRKRTSIYSRVQATASLKGPWRGEELSSGDESDEDGVDQFTLVTPTLFNCSSVRDVLIS